MQNPTTTFFVRADHHCCDTCRDENQHRPTSGPLSAGAVRLSIQRTTVAIATMVNIDAPSPTWRWTLTFVFAYPHTRHHTAEREVRQSDSGDEHPSAAHYGYDLGNQQNDHADHNEPNASRTGANRGPTPIEVGTPHDHEQ